MSFPNAPTFLTAVTGTWDGQGLYSQQVSIENAWRHNLIRGGTKSWWHHDLEGGYITFRGLYKSSSNPSANISVASSSSITLGGKTFSGLRIVSSDVDNRQLMPGRWAIAGNVRLHFESCS